MSNANKTVVLYEQANAVGFYLIDGNYGYLDQTFFDIDDPNLEGKELEVKNLHIGEGESSKLLTTTQAGEYIKQGAELTHFGCYN